MIAGTYPEIRPHIADGDLVAVRSRHGVFPNLTRLVTSSPYTHTAIALQLEGGLWIAEMRRGGNVLVPLSQRANEDFDVFDCPPEVDRVNLRGWLLSRLRSKIDYDVRDLARIAVNRLLGIPLPAQDDDQMVCSAWSAMAYLYCRWQPRHYLPSIASPGDVVRAFGTLPKAEFRRG